MSDKQPTHLAIIDGGGSTCRVAIINPKGDILGQATGGSANITSNFDAALNIINQTIKAAYNAAQLSHHLTPNHYAYLGLAGGKTPELAKKLVDALNFDKCEIVSDRKIMLQGAMGSADGTLVATGTGSFFVHRINGHMHKIGGWGLNLGDEASAAYLGKKLLQKTLHAHDGLTAHSHLTFEVFKQFNNSPREMIIFAKSATPNDYGKFAPLITQYIQKGDVVAEQILALGLNDILKVLDGWDVAASGNLYMMGGMGHIYKNLLPPHYKNLLKPPKHSALHGAIELALQKWCKQ